MREKGKKKWKGGGGNEVYFFFVFLFFLFFACRGQRCDCHTQCVSNTYDELILWNTRNSIYSVQSRACAALISLVCHSRRVARGRRGRRRAAGAAPTAPLPLHSLERPSHLSPSHQSSSRSERRAPAIVRARRPSKETRETGGSSIVSKRESVCEECERKKGREGKEAHTLRPSEKIGRGLRDTSR